MSENKYQKYNDILDNRTLLITGGTGSFGNEVLKMFLDTNIKEIRIFSRDEKKQDDMRRLYNNSKIKYFIGDIRDFKSIDYAMIGVDLVFHAAALKQVPSCEFFPMEAIKTNVMGTENAIEAALKNNVKKFILLSTDKAVYPINAMGLSKALAEKVLIAKSKQTIPGQTVFCATRYGNVMASRGSVIPLFIQQIKLKNDITITDPGMTRFMMTLEEAVELVMYAFSNGKQGDIFVQKSPASTIGDLAIALKEIYKSNSEIKIIGTRHGEKLYETLVTREEMARAEELPRYFRIPSDSRDLNYEKYFSTGSETISRTVEYTSHNTERLDVEKTKSLLLKLKEIREEIL